MTKENENCNFCEVFVSESIDCFTRIFLIAPLPKPPCKVHFHLYFPHVYLSLNFENRSKTFNFLTFLDMKSNFHFYFLKVFSSKSMDFELSKALSNVISSLKPIEIRSFKVMFRNAGRVFWLQCVLLNAGVILSFFF